ncbi:MAG TPA: hypothetical protein VGM50_08985 [Gemmatimonadaceae bacterium]
MKMLIVRRSSAVLALLVAAASTVSSSPAFAQITSGFLSLKDGSTVVKGFSITTGHQDDFELEGFSAAPASAGGSVTIHATISLESAPQIISALDRADNMSFDVTFNKPDRNAAAAFAILRAQHALVTNYAVTAVAGKLLQAQVTITAQQSALVSPTGATLTTPIPTIAASAPRPGGTSIRGNPITDRVMGALLNSGTPISGPSAGIALDTLTFSISRPAGTTRSMISSMHFSTHDDKALSLLTQVATRGDTLNGTTFKLYTPDQKGIQQSQAVFLIKLNGAAFPGTGKAAGGGSGAGVGARSDIRPVTPGSYDVLIAAAVASPGHVLEVQEPLRGYDATVH